MTLNLFAERVNDGDVDCSGHLVLTVTSARLVEGWLTVMSNTLVVDGNTCINQGLRLAVVD